VTRRATLAAALAVGLLLGVGVPLVELALDCRIRTSEACVWGRALLGVSLTVGAVLGLIAGTITYFVVRSLRRPPPPAA
jgi:hypothetical protein